MAYLAAPTINWGGDAPQAPAVLAPSVATPVIVPVYGNGIIPAPDQSALAPQTKGYAM